MKILVALFFALSFILSGCGGGGNGEVVHVTIDAPDASQTDLPEIYLSGTSFVPAGSYCYTNQTIPFRYIPGTYSIAWENLANNQSGAAEIWLFCEAEISWSILPAIALEFGENQIRVTVTSAEGAWQDVIVVTRVSAMAPEQ